MAEPSLETYHQTTWPNRLLTWLAATRPAFFSASVLVVISALALSREFGGSLEPLRALLTLLAITFIHAGANVLNDYYDHDNDWHNQQRLYPFSGGSRFIQNQVLSQTETLRLGWILLVVGMTAGLWLVSLSGPELLWLGLIGSVLAVFYSAPPCLACRGWGDVSIALSFGVLPMAGTLWIQLGEIPPGAWWLGAALGVFTAAILWINSIPDIPADRRAGKWTLPARLGPRYAPYGLPLLFALGFALLLPSPLSDSARWGWLGLPPALLACSHLLRGRLAAAIPWVLLTHASVALSITVAALSRC